LSAPRENPVAVVTGATSGLGREIARRLALAQYAVVVVGRGDERAAGVAKSIALETGNANVESLGVADLAVVGEMQRVARTLLERYPRIQLLVNNAGGMFVRRETTSDGLERTFALNVLAPYRLTEILADRLKASAPARVVNMASAAHYRQRVDFDDLLMTGKYRGYRAYGRSKLELILLTRELARRYAGSGVTVNAVHPGFVSSGFAQNNGGVAAFVVKLMAVLFGRSIRRGAETPVFVATDPTVANVTGEYFSNLHRSAGDSSSRDMAAAARLAAACDALVAGTRTGN
jgi:NAD(P)-dependent dehydrogenase (short-subunit alcohol dehydrogenase family)